MPKHHSIRTLLIGSLLLLTLSNCGSSGGTTKTAPSSSDSTSSASSSSVASTSEAISGNFLTAILSEIPPSFEPSPFSDVGNRMDLQVNIANDAAEYSWLAIDHDRFDEYLSITVLNETDNSWDVNIQSSKNSNQINQGDWVFASFYARSTSANDNAIFKAYIERPDPTWIEVASVSGVTASDWKRYIAFGQTEQNHNAESVGLSINLGNGIQAIDIAGLSIMSLNSTTVAAQLPYSAFTYSGMDVNATWRNTATQMINQNRKGDLQLKLVDQDQQALANTPVQVSLQKHSYEFGSFINRLLIEDSNDGTQYGQWLKDNFNVATTPVYWADWGWASAERQEHYRQMAAWLQQNEIPTRGHVLMYPGWDFAPQALRDLASNPEAFQNRIIAHLEEIVPIMQAYGVNEYDVTNELRDLTEVIDIVGLQGVVDWFLKVRELDPSAKLYINENTILTEGGTNQAAQDHYYTIIKTLIELGAPIDGIGMQGHSTEAATSPEKIWSILDRFAAFELPIRITEYDLNTRDTKGQAQYDVDFYTAIFAHPATVGITRWGFYEPVMWLPLGAIIDANGEYKPNGLAHQKLLFEDWTTDVYTTTNAEGEVTLNGFFGEYQLTALSEQLVINHDSHGQGVQTIQISTE